MRPPLKPFTPMSATPSRATQPGLRRRFKWVTGLLFASCLAAGACGVEEDVPVDDDDGDIIEPPSCQLSPAQRTPLRRLTKREYDNTVRALLGGTAGLAARFPAETSKHGFANNADGQGVSAVHVSAYELAAQTLAAAVGVVGLLACDPSEQQDACVSRFISTFGKRAYRRPLNSGERQSLFGFYVSNRDEYDHQTAVRMTLEAMLQSPHFLYRVEFGETSPTLGRSRQRLTPYELASRLSYLIYGSMPDEPLFAAADAGMLSSKEQVAAQARRMLGDARARDAIEDFHTQWLELDRIDNLNRDPKRYPSFNASLEPLMKQETSALVNHIVLDTADAQFSDYFRADYTFVNEPLADFYGYSGVSGEEFVRVEVNAEQRSGVFTQAAVLAGQAHPQQSSPVRRGQWVLDRLLCDPPPPPPANVNNTPPAASATGTTREKITALTKSPVCMSCHGSLNPVGFAFEHYDAVGLWRDEDNGRPVNAADELYNTDVDGPFEDAIELLDKLADSEQVRQCFTTQWFRFARGRGEEDQTDLCEIEHLDYAFATTGGNVRELVLSLTQTESFYYRASMGSGEKP